MKVKPLFLLPVLILVLLLVSCSGTGEKRIEQPNILLISIDDLNNWIEPLGGHPQAQTPNLARLADEAVTFTNSYAPSPSCNPSRTALMTGKAPYVTGLYNNPQIWRHILPDEITLPEYFQQAGYWTGGAGKIFHNNMPDPRSWDEYFPSLIRHMPEYYLPVRDSVTGETMFAITDNEIREDDPKGVTFTMPVFDRMYIAFDFEPLPYSTEETGDYSSVKWVMDQLGKKHDKPFFLAAGLYRPHLPWYVPQEFYDKFPLDQVQLPNILDNDVDDLPGRAMNIARSVYHRKIVEAGLWKNAVQGYLASINFADHLVGLLLDALDKSEYAENTIVIVYSDHGWQLGEKEHWRKFALWENVLNTVLMIRVPEGVPGLPAGSYNGSNSDGNVSLVDIFPTLTSLAGLTPKEGISGRDLTPLLKDPSEEWEYPVISVLGDQHYSVIYDRWHYINYAGEDEELYDLDEDPEEWYNLAGVDSLGAIKEQLKAFIPTDRAPLERTVPIRWADVLSGKIKFYND